MIKKEKILVIDDKKEILDVIKECLGHKYNLTLLESGIDALEELKKNGVDLILLDLYMPKMNGFEFLKQIKKDYSSIPIVMMSGKGDKKDIIEAINLGALGCIQKPIKSEKLEDEVQRVLRFTDSIRLEERIRYYDEILPSPSEEKPSVEYAKRIIGKEYSKRVYEELRKAELIKPIGPSRSGETYIIKREEEDIIIRIGNKKDIGQVHRNISFLNRLNRNYDSITFSNININIPKIIFEADFDDEKVALETRNIKGQSSLDILEYLSEKKLGKRFSLIKRITEHNATLVASGPIPLAIEIKNKEQDYKNRLETRVKENFNILFKKCKHSFDPKTWNLIIDDSSQMREYLSSLSDTYYKDCWWGNNLVRQKGWWWDVHAIDFSSIMQRPLQIEAATMYSFGHFINPKQEKKLIALFKERYNFIVKEQNEIVQKFIKDPKGFIIKQFIGDMEKSAPTYHLREEIVGLKEKLKVMDDRKPVTYYFTELKKYIKGISRPLLEDYLWEVENFVTNLSKKEIVPEEGYEQGYYAALFQRGLLLGGTYLGYMIRENLLGQKEIGYVLSCISSAMRGIFNYKRFHDDLETYDRLNDNLASLHFCVGKCRNNLKITS